MFRVLNQLPTSTSGIQPVAQHGYLVKEILRNLEAVQNHYQQFTFTVNSDHILYRLLASLPISFTESVQNYYDRIVDGTPEFANRVRMTTERYEGIPFYGEFYPGLSEGIFAHGSSRFISREVLENWRYWTPVRIYDHPFTDLRYFPLHPKKASSGYGNATIYIDVPMLAVQYRMWALSMSYVDNGVITVKEPIMSFLASYPLVNALWSHNDVVLRNRCFGLPDTQRLLSSPNNVTNQDNLLTQVTATCRDTLLRKPRSYTDMLYQMYGLNVNQFNATRLPYLTDLRQTRWVRDMGCLRIWDKLIQIADISGSIPRNGQQNNDLKRAIDRTLNEGTWTGSPLDKNSRLVVVDRLQAMLKILNRTA